MRHVIVERTAPRWVRRDRHTGVHGAMAWVPVGRQWSAGSAEPVYVAASPLAKTGSETVGPLGMMGNGPPRFPLHQHCHQSFFRMPAPPRITPPGTSRDFMGCSARAGEARWASAVLNRICASCPNRFPAQIATRIIAVGRAAGGGCMGVGPLAGLPRRGPVRVYNSQRWWRASC